MMMNKGSERLRENLSIDASIQGQDKWSTKLSPSFDKTAENVETSGQQNYSNWRICYHPKK